MIELTISLSLGDLDNLKVGGHHYFWVGIEGSEVKIILQCGPGSKVEMQEFGKREEEVEE